MRTRGYDLRISPGVYERDGYLAGSDAVRLRDLHAAFADPDIDAIFCLRGGYGTPRLLDSLDLPTATRNPKLFVGYSDITALHLAISRYAGFVTFQGPMLNADLLATSNNLPNRHCSAFCAVSWAPAVCCRPGGVPADHDEPGIACGRLLGGNLSMIAAVMGTPYEIDAEGIILFIEDVNEPIYRIDRLLTHLRLAGKWPRLRVCWWGCGGVDNAALERLPEADVRAFVHTGVGRLAQWALRSKPDAANGRVGAFGCRGEAGGVGAGCGVSNPESVGARQTAHREQAPSTLVMYSQIKMWRGLAPDSDSRHKQINGFAATPAISPSDTHPPASPAPAAPARIALRVLAPIIPSGVARVIAIGTQRRLQINALGSAQWQLILRPLATNHATATEAAPTTGQPPARRTMSCCT